MKTNQFASQYLVILDNFNEIAISANTTASLLASATESLDVTESALDSSRDSINSSRSILSDLRQRLDILEMEVERNRLALEGAEDLTMVVTDASLQIELVQIILLIN